MLTNARFGPTAIRRFDKHIDGAVELFSRPADVAGLKFGLPSPEVSIRLGQQRQHRIFGWGSGTPEFGRLRQLGWRGEHDGGRLSYG